MCIRDSGITTGLAVKIYKTYGDQAIAIVSRDPYRLAKDIFGIGFRTADKIAQDLGLPVDAPARIAAGPPGGLEALSGRGRPQRGHFRIRVLGGAARVPDVVFRPPVDRIVAQCPADRQTLFFSATLADLGYAGQVFVYTIDFATGAYHEETLTVPLSRGIALPRNSTEGESHFDNGKVRVSFKTEPEGRRLAVHWLDFGGKPLVDTRQCKAT